MSTESPRFILCVYTTRLKKLIWVIFCLAIMIAALQKWKFVPSSLSLGKAIIIRSWVMISQTVLQWKHRTRTSSAPKAPTRVDELLCPSRIGQAKYHFAPCETGRKAIHFKALYRGKLFNNELVCRRTKSLEGHLLFHLTRNRDIQAMHAPCGIIHHEIPASIHPSPSTNKGVSLTMRPKIIE